jgi:hypothetical protein
MLLIGMSIWKSFMAATAEELSSVIILYTKFFSLCSIYWRFGFWSSVLYTIGWIGKNEQLNKKRLKEHRNNNSFIVLSTIFPQPWYRGPTKIFELNDTAFKEKVLLKKQQQQTTIDDIKGPRITEIIDDKNDDKKEKKKVELDSKYWIVMLYANWSVTCLNFEPVLAKLSIEYDLPHLKFGKGKKKKKKKKKR